MFNRLLEVDSFFKLLGLIEFWLLLLILVGSIFLLVFSIRYWHQGGKLIFLSIFTLVISIFTIFSIIEINAYYSASGGIYGVLTGQYDPNRVEVVNEYDFLIFDVELTEKLDGTYSASFITDKVISLDTKNDLGIFINEVPCSFTEVTSDYVIAEYTYTFYDNEKNVMANDTLYLNIAFNKLSTSLELSTKCDATTLDLWHSYFNRNDFVVSIAPFNCHFKEDMNFVVGDIGVANISITSSVTSYSVLYNKEEFLPEFKDNKYLLDLKVNPITEIIILFDIDTYQMEQSSFDGFCRVSSYKDIGLKVEFEDFTNCNIKLSKISFGDKV